MPNTPLKRTAFLKSAEKPRDFPPDVGIEIAFAGRSNAGKSTVINAITRAGMAKTSKTPGRTRLVNFFEVFPKKLLVDLPGFGYAKVSKSIQANWQTTLDYYFANRTALKGAILIMDIRHPLKNHDLEFLDYCNSYKIQAHILLNKADKLSKSDQNQALQATTKKLTNYQIPLSLQLFSSPKKIGIDDLNGLLIDWLKIT